jgi:RHS repeat-associated protein
VRKHVPGNETRPAEVTVFVYDATGKLVMEYSTIVESTNDAKVAYLTNDHLGSPRINTDVNGHATSRHDYHPFGEEISTTQRTGGVGYADDKVRKQFTGYERDGETDLDFAQARMYSKNLGRFITVDPLFFQLVMSVDPQRFNLYGYARNNPLKWVDPKGEDLRIRGTVTIQSLYEMAGGQEEFDKNFVVENGVVSLREGGNISEANSGVQFIAGLVNDSENYLFYAGDNFSEIADLFEGATNARGDLTSDGKKIRERFQGSSTRSGGVGIIAAVRGRPGNEPLTAVNGDPLFSLVAYNTSSRISMTQTGVAMGSESRELFPSPGIVSMETQLAGIGKPVRASGVFIHEGAEAQEFGRIGFRNVLGRDNYPTAHRHAMRTEERIKNELRLPGGFAGGALTTRRTQ